MISTASSSSRRGSMSWVPWAFVGGFAIVIAVNAVLIVMATRTFSGLVVEKPYLKGIAYERTLEREAAQAALGWTVTTAFKPTAMGGDVSVRYLDRQGAPLTSLSVSARVESPLGPEAKIDLSLVYRGDGWYAAPIALPRAGQWEIDTVARQNGRDVYERQFRVLVK